MAYSVDEFLADYKVLSNPLLPLPENLTPEKFSEILHVFFMRRYKDVSVARERENAFRKTMLFIWNSHESLVATELMVERPKKYGSLYDRSLLCGAFDMVVIRGIERATIEQLRESISKFL